MKNKEDVIMSNKIQYRRVGDYLIPNLILPPEEASVTLGKWGMLHKNYLLNHKKVLFSTLLTQGKLYQHCAEVEKQANDMFDRVFFSQKTCCNIFYYNVIHNKNHCMCKDYPKSDIISEKIITCNSTYYKYAL